METNAGRSAPVCLLRNKKNYIMKKDGLRKNPEWNRTFQQPRVLNTHFAKLFAKLRQRKAREKGKLYGR